MKPLCDGWQQAIAVNEQLIGRGEFAHARRNLTSIARFLRIFSTAEALSQLTVAQRGELKALETHLDRAWQVLYEAADRIADDSRIAV